MIKKLFIISLTTVFLQGCSNIFNSPPLVEEHITKTSWYDQGYKTASGARFNPKSLTAAHRDLPFGTLIKITNTANNKTVVAMVNDRGPFIKGRGLDVSKQVAIELGFIKKGVTEVSYYVLQTPLK